jgi:hypothetical protein
MKDAIVDKIRNILDSGVDSECKVFYVLGEVRKLLEKYPPEVPPFALILYCNWALHIDLSRPKTTSQFLSRVDKYVSSVLEKEKADIVSDHDLFREFVFFDSFRAQLKALFTQYDLPTTVCDDEGFWHTFLEHYAGIIEDGSLSCDCDGKNMHLKQVSRVVFTKGRARDGSHVPFGLSWQIDLKNSGSLILEVYADIEGGVGSVLTLS